ncbi:hypothetical protein [Enterobacter kobei]|uniref:Uncharacterized protein n=1 Tax=Enterobacter kobei TaxID=208224 RepID=A0AAJ6MLM6_9ENTR|nr:hypothetical protein [Enterobacter kobei]WMT66282.1 hypothetical protein M2B19_01465 [Enterobacter kobei]
MVETPLPANTSNPCFAFATKGRHKKSKRLAPRLKTGGQIKANDYPALTPPFSTELYRFSLKFAYDAEEINRGCANVIVYAQFVYI